MSTTPSSSSSGSRKRSKEPPPEHHMQTRAHHNQSFLSYSFMVTYYEEDMDAFIYSVNKYIDIFQYAVYQCEFVSKTGNRHWQVYIEFKEPVSPDFVKKRIFEDANKTHVQRVQVLPYDTYEVTRLRCRHYCMKNKTRLKLPEAGPLEIGEWLMERPDAEEFTCGTPTRASIVTKFP